MEAWNMESLNSLLLAWSKNLLAAAAILLVGWFVMRLVAALVGKTLRGTRLDEIVVQFAQTIVRIVVLAVAVVAALERLGIQTTSLVAALGAFGLALGLALQDSLKNFASGLMLVARQPFRADDYVEAGGTAGVVEEISLITTTLRTSDNRSVIVPNGQIFHDVIINYSARARRRIDMVFGIGYDDDIDTARRTIEEILQADARVLADPAPVVAVHELADSSVNFVVRPWVATDEYWAVRWDLTERIKLAFDAEEIGIPFPQMDVRVRQVA
jgi:small conductance mechanosensitive channel